MSAGSHTHTQRMHHANSSNLPVCVDTLGEPGVIICHYLSTYDSDHTAPLLGYATQFGVQHDPGQKGLQKLCKCTREDLSRAEMLQFAGVCTATVFCYVLL